MNKNLLRKLASMLAFLSLASSSMSAEDTSKSKTVSDDCQNNGLAAEDSLGSSDSFTSKIYTNNFKQKDSSIMSFVKKNKKIVIPIAVSIPLLFTSYSCFRKNNDKKLDIPEYKDDEHLKIVMAEDLLDNQIKNLGFSDNEKTWIKVLMGTFGATLDVKKGNSIYKISCKDFRDKVKDVDYPSFVFFPTYKKSESHTDGVFSELYLGGKDNPAKLKAYQELLKNDFIRGAIKANIYKNACCFLGTLMEVNETSLNFKKKNKEVTAGSFKDYDLKKITRILESLKIFSSGKDELEKLYNKVMGILEDIKNKTEDDTSVSKQFIEAYEGYFVKTNTVPSIYDYDPSKENKMLAEIIKSVDKNPDGEHNTSLAIVKTVEGSENSKEVNNINEEEINTVALLEVKEKKE